MPSRVADSYSDASDGENSPRTSYELGRTKKKGEQHRIPLKEALPRQSGPPPASVLAKKNKKRDIPDDLKMVKTRTGKHGKGGAKSKQNADDRLTPAEAKLLKMQQVIDKQKEELLKLRSGSKHKQRYAQESPRALKKSRHGNKNGRGNLKKDEDYDTEETSVDEDEDEEVLVCTKKDDGTGTWAVTGKSGELKYIIAEVKEVQWKHIKFLSNEAQKHGLMDRIIANTSRGDRLKSLSPHDRKIQIQAYLNLYGSRMMTALNGQRSQLQQSLKKAWQNMMGKGINLTAEDVYLASQRYGIDELPEKTTNGKKKIPKNIKANKENKKYRDNFDNYNIHVIGSIGGHGWKEPHFTKMPIQGDPEAALDPGFTVDDEAMAVLIWMNCSWKWELQWHLVNGRYPAGHSQAGKKAKKKHFLCPYTRTDVGSNQLSGWNKAGREKFLEVRRQIKHGRTREGALDAEWASRSRLYFKFGWDKKEKPKKKGALRVDLSGAIVEFGDQVVEEEEVKGVKKLERPMVGQIIIGDSDNEEEADDKSEHEPPPPAEDPKANNKDVAAQIEENAPKEKEEDSGAETQYQVDENGEFLLDHDGHMIPVEDDDGSMTEGQQSDDAPEDDDDEEVEAEGAAEVE